MPGAGSVRGREGYTEGKETYILFRETGNKQVNVERMLGSDSCLKIKLNKTKSRKGGKKARSKK